MTITPRMITASPWTAAEILREISAGHEDAAGALADASGLGHLSAGDLEALCAAAGVEI